MRLRDCLENSWTGLCHVFLAAQSADKDASGPVMPTRRASVEPLRIFQTVSLGKRVNKVSAAAPRS
jgi:hypothetical protein